MSKLSLGQFVASDTESEVQNASKPKNVVKKLLRQDEELYKHFCELMTRMSLLQNLLIWNGANALKWLNTKGVISPTQHKSAFDSKGNPLQKRRMILRVLCIRASSRVVIHSSRKCLCTTCKARRKQFCNGLSHYDSPQSERMIEDIQNSIMAYYALSHDSMFMNAKNHKEARIAARGEDNSCFFDDVTGESYLPAENIVTLHYCLQRCTKVIISLSYAKYFQ